MAYIDSESDVIDLTLDSDTDESATNVPSLKKLKRYKMPDSHAFDHRTYVYAIVTNITGARLYRCCSNDEEAVGFDVKAEPDSEYE